MRRIRLWTTIAVIASFTAICFSAVLIGLDAKAVKDGIDVANVIQYWFGFYKFLTKYKIISAQLAFACVEFLLCFAFIITYFVVLILATKHTRRQRRQPTLRPPLR